MFPRSPLALLGAFSLFGAFSQARRNSGKVEKASPDYYYDYYYDSKSGKNSKKGSEPVVFYFKNSLAELVFPDYYRTILGGECQADPGAREETAGGLSSRLNELHQNHRSSRAAPSGTEDIRRGRRQRRLQSAAEDDCPPEVGFVFESDLFADADLTGEDVGYQSGNVLRTGNINYYLYDSGEITVAGAGNIVWGNGAYEAFVGGYVWYCCVGDCSGEGDSDEAGALLIVPPSYSRPPWKLCDDL